MTNASIDIMYIDMQRKFDHMNPERTSGMYFTPPLMISEMLDIK